MLPLRARVDLGGMVMKGYSALPKRQHYWNLAIRLLTVISRILVGGGGGDLPYCREAVGVFYSPSKLGNWRCSSWWLVVAQWKRPLSLQLPISCFPNTPIHATELWLWPTQLTESADIMIWSSTGMCRNRMCRSGKICPFLLKLVEECRSTHWRV